MDDYVDADMQLAPLEELEPIDWEGIMQDPWFQYNWAGNHGQSAEAQPVIGNRVHSAQTIPPMGQEFMYSGYTADTTTATVDSIQLAYTEGDIGEHREPYEAVHASHHFTNVNNTEGSQAATSAIPEENQPTTNKPAFKCEFEGCSSKPFKRHYELRRHLRTQHDDSQPCHSCTAQNCPRMGKRGFKRKDKLLDHMLAGHDNDTLFTCPQQGQYGHARCDSVFLTRDFMSVHLRFSHLFLEAHDDALRKLNDYRDCPLPKCPYRIYVGREGRTLDPLQKHILAEHDAKGRASFSTRILERGYDAMSGEIVCPVCLGKARFSEHNKFYHHVLEVHLGTSDISGNSEPLLPYRNSDVYRILRNCGHVPDEVRQYRRTILSLWPDFDLCPSVWDDIKPHF